MRYKYLGYIVLLLAAVMLNGCGDIASYDGGIASEATQVQDAISNTISVDTITLNWELPADISGYLGVTITEESGAGSLTHPVELDAAITEYTVTNLNPDTAYRFTITTRYRERGKNNDAELPAMTALATVVQNIGIDDSATTSNSITLTWNNPHDTDSYTGVAISIASTVGDFDTNTPRMVEKGTTTLVIGGLEAETSYTLALTFDTQYGGGNSGNSRQYTTTVVTQSTRVRTLTANALSGTTIVLSWEDPEDTNGYTGVTISAEPAAGRLSSAATVHATEGSARVFDVTGLTAVTSYDFTLTTQYTAGKRGASTSVTAMTHNPVDVDGDALIDISSLERLNNVRYNLDVGAAIDDGRYKESTQIADGEGTLCGATAATKCIGYELTHSLDFEDGTSYDSAIVNGAWRPQDILGVVLTQDNAENAINAGWDPIGSCRADALDTNSDACNDGDDTPFATRFEGNGFAISNLYARNTAATVNAATGLFGIIDSRAIIRNIGVTDAALYGNNAAEDYVGGLLGFNNSGTITASYVHNTMAAGGVGTWDNVGGLAGANSGAIIASYVRNTTADGGNDGEDRVGGLVGTNSGTIIANYVQNTTANGGEGARDAIGGLVGNNSGTIAASYASGTADGGMGDFDRLGGLVGSAANSGSVIIASYATVNTDGSSGDNSRASSLVGRNTITDISGTVNGTITASYGFGTIVNADSAGRDDSGDRPSAVGASGSGIAGARQLTAPGTGATTAAASEWNDDDQNTQDAWHFGTTGQAPALQYADYDGAGTEYGCGTTTGTIATIPSVIPDGAGGTITIVCGTTLLPGQER